MKMTKRISAMIMAVMLIVAMIPFAVSAATPKTSFTVKCDTEGFKFDVYQIATVDTETGLYTAVATDEGIAGSVNGGAQDLFAACEAANEGLGTSVLKYTSGAEATVNGDAGIFYIKCTEKPSTVKAVSNSLVVAPEYKHGAWVDLTEAVDLTSKVSTGSVSVSKEIVGTGTYTTAKHTTASVGDTVTFKLTASVVGSASEKLKDYTINDTHDKALEFDEVKKVEVIGGEGDDYELEADTDYTVTDETDTGFNVKLTADALNNDAFYSKADVVVTYTAKLTSDAVIGNPGNKNHDALSWTNSSDVTSSEDGNDVYVYTFALKINKKESGTDKALEGVKFAVYKTNDDAKAGTNALKSDLTTDKDGVIEVNGIDAGTYFVKETASIEGYNLNTKIYEIKIDPEFANDKLASLEKGVAEITVYNTKSKLPQTGMEGTMMFTFIGAVLVLIAGALFVVAMKKKSAK